MSGPITALLAADHRRIGALLAAAREGDRASYDGFRGALLRHIGIEEKIVLPALRAQRSAPSVATQLRLDHAALVAMLVPPPTRDLLARMATLLELHDALEEEPHTLYPVADDVLKDARPILDRIERAPVPPLAPNFDDPRAYDAIETLLSRAAEARSRR